MPRKYELLYIIHPDLDDDSRNEIIEKFKRTVESGGSVLKVDEWGKRRLAYLIDDCRFGYYVLMHLEGEPELVQEVDRTAKLTEGVLRHLIVSLDED